MSQVFLNFLALDCESVLLLLCRDERTFEKFSLAGLQTFTKKFRSDWTEVRILIEPKFDGFSLLISIAAPSPQWGGAH